MKTLVLFLLALPLFGVSVYPLGTNEFADGSIQTPANFQTGVDPAPFNLATGGDATANASFTLTFSYSPLSGITAASLLLSLWDLESSASSTQIGSFTLNGTENLTSSLNTLSEAAATVQQQITYFTLALPSSAFDELETGTATFVLTFSGPALGALTETTFNGGGVDFAQLTLDTVVAEVPEPASLLLVGAGLGLIGWRRARQLNKARC